MSQSSFVLSDVHVAAVGILFEAGPENGASKRYFLAREAIESLAGARIGPMDWEAIFYRHIDRIGDVAQCLVSTGSDRFPIVLNAGYFPRYG